MRCGPAPSPLSAACAAPQRADPEARTRLPGQVPAPAACTLDAASGKRLQAPCRSAPREPALEGAAVLPPRFWCEKRRQRQGPGANPCHWEPRAQPLGAVALGLSETHEAIYHKRHFPLFAWIPKRTGSSAAGLEMSFGKPIECWGGKFGFGEIKCRSVFGKGLIFY